MVKKLLAVILALTLCVGGCLTVFAEAEGESEGDSDSSSGAVALEVLDYSDMANWECFAEGDGAADLFFICPTVAGGDDGTSNMAMTDENKADFDEESQSYFNAFGKYATLYAPYYQQGTLIALLFSGDEALAEAAYETAYKDISAAFAYYLENSDPSRPLILAAHSQGAHMLIELLKEYFDDEALQDRLVAAYALGWILTEEEVEEYPWIVPAEGEDDTGVVIVYNTEAADVTESITVLEGQKSICINPLNWTTDGTVADKSLNKGMRYSDQNTGEVSEVVGYTGAYINEERGTLVPTEVDVMEWYVPIFPMGVFHAFDLPFFYENIKENVAVRLAAWLGVSVDELAAREGYSDEMPIIDAADFVIVSAEETEEAAEEAAEEEPAEAAGGSEWTDYQSYAINAVQVVGAENGSSDAEIQGYIDIINESADMDTLGSNGMIKFLLTVGAIMGYDDWCAAGCPATK